MSIFKWTSPIRQGGLSPIPNEVFMEIFKYLRPPDNDLWIDLVDRRVFSRVALVCRFFCSVMLPWIFESLVFEGKKSNGSLNLNHAPFFRSIIRGCGSARTMATYVKRCWFWDWMQDENDSTPSWSIAEFQTLYSRALAFMPNVEELKLSRVDINKYLLKSIMELKCLTSLTLDFSRGEVKTKNIRKLSTLHLKHLRLFGHSRVDDISEFLCLDSLLTVDTDCLPFVARIAEQNCNLPLQELIIYQVPDAELLPKIFQKTPALQKLRILSTVTSYHDVQFDDVLPHLNELCCSLFLLRCLVPGRPISSIEITSNVPTEITDIQSFFKKSTRKIRSVCGPFDVYKTIPFSEHFPHLESLKLIQDHRPYLLTEQSVKNALSDMSNAWPHNPPIQELHVVFVLGEGDPFFDLELQYKLISTLLSPRFPQLRRISISSYVVWNKVQEDDVWKPSLHLYPLLFVAKRLRSGEVNPVDYDGFFERILSTAEEFW